jgi:hypothetical protein
MKSTDSGASKPDIETPDSNQAKDALSKQPNSYKLTNQEMAAVQKAQNARIDAIYGPGVIHTD